MSIKSKLRKLLIRHGFEVNRFNPAQSISARLQQQLTTNQIDLVLDIGANDGGYVQLIRESGYSGPVLSFEPLSTAHARLQRLAAGDPKWHVAERMALGDVEEEARINVAANSTSSSLLPMLPTHLSAAPGSRYQGQEVVTVRRLDGIDSDLVSNASSIFMKLDVQGFEMAVLRGATGLLDRVRGFQLECSLVPLYEAQTLYRELFDWMEQHGFDLWGIVPGFTDMATGRMLQMDGIFFRRD